MQKYFFLIYVFCLFISGFGQSKDPKEWLTYFERSNYLETSQYDETIKYFKQFETSTKFCKLKTFGITPQGREMKVLIVAKNGEFTAEKAKLSKKAIVLIEAGIHAGEIEGKDAFALLLREILIDKKNIQLLDSIILLVIPVFNVDGLERFSAYNRINQNGPIRTGWRTTAQNYNLNRDFLKADSPEMQSFLKLYSEWLPDFFVDSHTTDGADFQYSINYGIEKHQNIFSETGEWIKKYFLPDIIKRVEADGFLIAPYTDFREHDIIKGMNDWVSSPRLSTGYAATQNRPALLIETHSLKPYKTRVFSTKSCVMSVLENVYENTALLKELNRKADIDAINSFAKNKKAFPLSFKNDSKFEMFKFKGFKSKKDSSWITGNIVTRYSQDKYEIEIPFYNQMLVTDSLYAPFAYIIPKEWTLIIDRLSLHGIKFDEMKEDKLLLVEKTKFKKITFESRSNEGHIGVNYEYETFNEKVNIPKGSYIVFCDQRTIKIILFLLEPKSIESFLKWGYFNSIFEQKEYFEEYSMEPIAEKMMKDDPKLKEEFEKKCIEDEKFNKSSYQRLNFFYEHSPYYDKQFNIYPIYKILEKFN